MEIILITRRTRAHGRIHLGATAVVLLLLLLCGAGGASFYLGYRSAPRATDVRPDLYAAAWRQEVLGQRLKVDRALGEARAGMDALTAKLGDIQARAIRLDALGARLVRMAKLDRQEFDFGQQPAQGGPEVPLATATLAVPDFISDLQRLSAELQDRAPKLRVLEGRLMIKQLATKVYPSGRPVKRGWISSFFGERVDPFTGHLAMHPGIDFAGRPGSDVIAVAAGVVVFSGRRTGYGNCVELDHGNGYATLYAHNRRNLVKVGDTVHKGEVIARMGSTGRSTGPHVHFEVLRNGRPVNPLEYVRAAN